MAELSELIAAHTEALAAYDGLSDQEFDLRGAELSIPVDLTRDAILDHRPTTLEEVAIKAAFMASTRSFYSWDDFEPIKLINALTPVAGGASCA
jgi:hypothetical protein